MTATTATTATNHRQQTVRGPVHRLARIVGSILATIGSRWNDLVDAGQLGPRADTVISRHTGARI
jgi:hypothetical protein